MNADKKSCKSCIHLKKGLTGHYCSAPVPWWVKKCSDWTWKKCVSGEDYYRAEDCVCYHSPGKVDSWPEGLV